MWKTPTTNELKAAIQKLEAFARMQVAWQEGSPVSKTIALMRSFLLDKLDLELSKKEKSQPASQTELLEAVELINRERLLIQKLQKGTPAEQKLAESFTKAISTYNEILEQQSERRRSSTVFKLFSKKLPRSAHNLPKIDLPRKQSIEYHYSESPTKIDGKRFCVHAQQTSNIPLPQQSIELFHMKVISLLERYDIATNPEARAIIKQTPIQTVLEIEDQPRCTLTQTLTLFPGQTIRVMGSSEFDPKTHKIHKISPGTFAISLESNQTGFPHASQRAGWTLSHPLLHDCPQRIDLLSATAEILKKKRLISATLLPHTPELEKAKRLMRMKKKVFNAHREQFVALHKRLALALAKSSHPSDDRALEWISPFYDPLLREPNLFERLSHTNQMISELFITQPHQALLQAILHGDIALNRQNPRLCYQNMHLLFEGIMKEAEKQAARLKEASGFEQPHLNYVEQMGKIIGKSALSIILQYLSEDLMFQPPTLSLFDQKVQAAVYQHVIDFTDELTLSFEQDPEEQQPQIYQLLTTAIEQDISLFEENEEELQIPKELYAYFELRHFSLFSSTQEA